MIALIDLDPLPYAYGGITYEDGTILSDSMLRKMIDDKIRDIVARSGASDWYGYLTNSSSNFRIDVATILPYKGNRAGNEKPPKYQMLRDYLMDTYSDRVSMVEGMEADDALAIYQYKRMFSWPIGELMNFEELKAGCNTIICTIDKDLEMVPGWHYKWSKGNTEETPPFFITEIEGLRFFYKQLLTGDMTDNIRGLYGVSTKSKLLSNIDEMDTEQDMFLYVQEQYVKRFGNYADQFMLENGILLHMKRSKDDVWEFPTIIKPKEEEDELSF